MSAEATAESAPRSTRSWDRRRPGGTAARATAASRRGRRGGRDARDERTCCCRRCTRCRRGVGWISEGGLNYVCERLTVPPAEAYGVATFYAMFSVSRARRRSCTSATTSRAGVNGDALSPSSNAPSARRHGRRRRVGVVGASPCLGMCDVRPRSWSSERAEREDDVVRSRDRDEVRSLLGDADEADGAADRPGGPSAPDVGRRSRSDSAAAARRPGRPELARRLPGARRVRGAARAIELGPERRDPRDHRRQAPRPRRRGVPDRREVEGRGRAAGRPHYVICNADESEPGTFKDRV